MNPHCYMDMNAKLRPKFSALHCDCEVDSHFIRVISLFLWISSSIVCSTTCFYDLGLSRPGIEPRSPAGVRSTSTPPRRFSSSIHSLQHNVTSYVVFSTETKVKFISKLNYFLIFQGSNEIINYLCPLIVQTCNWI